MIFAYPYLIFLPLLFLPALFSTKKSRNRIFYPQVAIFSEIDPGWKVRWRKPLLGSLLLLIVVALTIAAARPQRQTILAEDEESRNLMLTLDLSGSMGTKDFPTGFGRGSRMEAVKSVISEFIEARPKDRIGLVIFGTNAYLQSPLTRDHSVIISMVKRLQVGMAGEDTAIGDGLGLSLKRIQEIPGTSKAIILLTDGVNRAGQVNPLKAAKIAKDLGIKIHTIGIGTNDVISNRLPGFPFSNQSQGEFDEETLKKIASITGGVYFNASSLEGLKNVYRSIDQLEKSSAEDPAHKIIEELFPKATLVALVGYLIFIILSRTIFLKIP